MKKYFDNFGAVELYKAMQADGTTVECDEYVNDEGETCVNEISTEYMCGGKYACWVRVNGWLIAPALLTNSLAEALRWAVNRR